MLLIQQEQVELSRKEVFQKVFFLYLSKGAMLVGFSIKKLYIYIGLKIRKKIYIYEEYFLKYLIIHENIFRLWVLILINN